MINILFLLTSVASASPTPCDQKIYDQFYEQVALYNVGIITERIYRMNEFFQKGTPFVEPTRADFEPIRRLCHGQTATQEIKNAH
jgi:hypothetical protein